MKSLASSSKSSVALKGATEFLFKELRSITRGSPYQLLDEIHRMRNWLTRDRELRPSGYMNQPRAFSAYTAYHLPLHLTEVFWILEQTFDRLKLSPPKKILDVGSGPGTTTLSLLLWLQHRRQTLPEQITFFDQSSRAISTAKTLSTNLLKFLDSKNSPIIKSIRGNLFHRKDVKQIGAGFDWVLISHVLNEFGNGPRHREKKWEFLKNLIRDQMPKSGGYLLIVEPPLRECTLDLMWIRDQFAKLGRDATLFPELTADEEISNLESELDISSVSTKKKSFRARGKKIAQRSETRLQIAEEIPEFFGDEEDDPTAELLQPTVLAPCPGHTIHCPMALAKAGWCYAQPPREQFRALGLCPWDSEIEASLRIRWSAPGFSYLLVHAHGSKSVQKEAPVFQTSRHAIALTDATRTPSQVCREKRIRKEGRAPYRGAYLKEKVKSN